MASQSYGDSERRSMISTEIPSRSSCAAATSARCTMAPKVTMLTSLPSLTKRALPKAGDIQRGARHHDAQAGAMRENGFAALAVINAATCQVAADGDSEDGGTLEIAVGAPAQDAEFVANLHHCRPDVVEELDFGDGLQPARSHADGAADDAGFGQGRIENAIVAVLSLQAGGGLENAALPFYVLQIFAAAGVGYVFTEDGDALVARHFVGERSGAHLDHGFGRTVKLRLGGESW